MEKGHGRIETRKIAVSREVVPYLAWPGLAQVARIERRREIARKASTEIVYLITSLPPETPSPQPCCASPGTIGASRTGSITSATSASPRIDAASAPVPAPWHRCATSPSPSSAGPVSQSPKPARTSAKIAPTPSPS